MARVTFHLQCQPQILKVRICGCRHLQPRHTKHVRRAKVSHKSFTNKYDSFHLIPWFVFQFRMGSCITKSRKTESESKIRANIYLWYDLWIKKKSEKIFHGKMRARFLPWIAVICILAMNIVLEIPTLLCPILKICPKLEKCWCKSENNAVTSHIFYMCNKHSWLLFLCSKLIL